MSYRYAIILLLAFLCSNKDARAYIANDYNFTHIMTTNSKLSYDGVSLIMQDSRGFIWIGTYNGLNRYDGNTLTVYHRSDLGLRSDFIHAIKEDGNGNLWIGTDNGITKYDYQTDRFEPILQKSESGKTIDNKVTFIDIDKEGEVWILANEQGCFKYDIKTGLLTDVPYREMGATGFRRILRRSDGKVFLSRYYSNLYSAGSDLKEVEPLELDGSPNYFADDEIVGFFAAPRGNLYVASLNNGLTWVDTNARRAENLFRLPDHSLLQEAFMEGDSVFWFSTIQGVCRYSLNTATSIWYKSNKSDRFSLSSDNINCTFVDRDGGLWVGTKDNGVDYAGPYQNNFEKQYMADAQSLSGVNVSAFVEDTSGRIWIATAQRGLFFYDPATHQTHHVDNSRIPVRICAMSCDEGSLWLGTQNGLSRYWPATGKVKDYGILQKRSGVNDPNVYMVYTNPRDGKTFVGSTIGLFEYERQTDSFREIEAFDGVYTTYMAQNPADGNYWCSTFATGVLCWNPRQPDKLTSYHALSGCGLPNNKIASVFVDSRARVWAVGFSIGFARLYQSEGRFAFYDHNTLPSLASDVFFRVLEDDKGMLWLTSDKGLIEFNPSTLSIHNYTEFDGLLDSRFTPSALRSSTGDFYFGSENGFIRFNPNRFAQGGDGTRVILNSMQIGAKTVDWGRNIDLVTDIRLKPKENSFGFNFSIMDFSKPQSRNVQCRLYKYEKEWRNISLNEPIYYYNIPPGSYEFSIRISSNSVDWVEAHRPIRIVVATPFWFSPLGILLGLLLLGAIVFVVIYVAARRSRKIREAKEQAYRKHKDEEMFQEKMNFFSHVIHEIKTPLTLLRTPLNSILSKNELDEDARHDLDVMHNSTEYLTKLVNELLDFVRIEKMGYTLKCEEFDIVERIRLLLFDYSDTIRNSNLMLDFKTDVGSAVVCADVAAVDKILNNILLNAVKYADSHIGVRLSADAQYVSIAFSNDGVAIPEAYREEIFKPFVQYKDEPHSAGGGVGIGLPLSRNLARMHSGDVVVRSEGEDTCFVLTLPVVRTLVDTLDEAEAPESEASLGSERPCIMIVDDNEDFRKYLASKLGQDYDVILQPNANHALEVLKERNVDMLLSDISMPGKSGLQLCEEVRNEIEISHIPIIIISARGSVESKIQAMQAGADLYLEKPFDMDYLRTSVKNILDRRLLMKKAYSKGMPNVDIDIFKLPKKDEEFFVQLDRLIRDNIANAELSNEFLAEQLGMSQSTLVRKIRKLLNTSPNNYVRTMRVSIAAELLRSSQGNNISDICYATGFSSLSYFSKCFKEQYGVTPTEFIAKK